MFSGNYQHVIDSKGRVSVPAAFRDLVQASGGPSLYLARCPVSPPRCLEGYPASAWQDLRQKLAGLNRFDPHVFKLEIFFVGSAHRCDIDNQGRILIPPALRDWANLSKDLFFVGVGNGFRIFDRDAWQQALSDAETTFKANPELLGRLNF